AEDGIRNRNVTGVKTCALPILQELNQIVKQVVESRKSEGRYLHKDMEERVTKLKNMSLLIEERQNVMHEQYKERIKQRIEASIEIGRASCRERMYKSELTGVGG